MNIVWLNICSYIIIVMYMLKKLVGSQNEFFSTVINLWPQHVLGYKASSYTQQEPEREREREISFCASSYNVTSKVYAFSFFSTRTRTC